MVNNIGKENHDPLDRMMNPVLRARAITRLCVSTSEAC